MEPDNIDSHLTDAKDIDFGPGPQNNDPKPESEVDDPKPESKTESKVSLTKDILGMKDPDTEDGGDEGARESEQDPVDNLPDPPDDAKSAPDWKRLKSIAKERAQRISELEAKLASLESGVKADEATLARLKELEEQNTTLSERLKALDFRHHPEYESRFVQPLEEARSEIEELLKAEGVEADVDRLMSLTGREYAEEASRLLGELSEFSRLTARDTLHRMLKIRQEAAKAESSMDEFLKEATEKQMARYRETFEKTADEYAMFAPLKVPEGADPEVAKEIEHYNESLGALRSEAEKYAFSGDTPESRASIAWKAANFDFLLKTGLPRIEKEVSTIVSSLDARVKELEEELATVTKSRPKYSGGDTNQDGDSGDLDHLSAAKMIDFGV